MRGYWNRTNDTSAPSEVANLSPLKYVVCRKVIKCGGVFETIAFSHSAISRDVIVGFEPTGFGLTIVLKYPRLSLCDIYFYREIVKVGIMSLMVLESNQLCIYRKNVYYPLILTTEVTTLFATRY